MTIDTKQFIQKLQKVHGNYYAYDDSIQIASGTKMRIICPKHGDFFQLPHNHLRQGCPRCKSARDPKNLEKMLEDFKKVHGDRYDYSLITNNLYSNTKAKIICKAHGEFEQKVANHLNKGYGCPLCGTLRRSVTKRSTTQKFVEKAVQIHSNKFNYSETIYVTALKKIKIICNIHEYLFEQTPNKHLSGQGCPRCRLEAQGWTRTKFKNFCDKNNGNGILYIIRCFNENEEFYKIGITSVSVKKRFDCGSKMPYNYEITQEIKDTPEVIYDLEHILHRRYSSYKYKPNIQFKGSTECFKI